VDAPSPDEMDTKEMKAPKEEAVEPTEVVVVEVVSVDPSAALVSDLAPYVARLRSSALVLLLFSSMFIGTLEGLFGFVAAAGILCCSPPGHLGVAHAARCTRITATISAALSLVHTMCLFTFVLYVLPEMPAAMHRACAADAASMAAFPAVASVPAEGAVVPADGAAAAAPQGHFTGFLASVGVDIAYAPKIVKKPESPPKPAVAPASAKPLVADDEIDAEILPSTPATLVASVTAVAARRLEVVHGAPPPVACARAKEMFESAAPAFLYAAMMVELALFYAAFSTAKAAGRLVLAARLHMTNA